MKSIEVNQIEKLINVAINNLKIHFRSDNGKNGWHQYLGSEKIGNIATAQALLLLNECNEDFDQKHLAYDFLKNSQQKNTDNKLIGGGWTYATNFSELPTTECTCWVLFALLNNYSNSKNAKNGINWLLNNHPNLGKDSGWGTIKSDKPRIYSTCLALKVLKKYNYESSIQFKSALNWLIQSQNTDSGWGEQFGYKSTIFHTSYVIITLLEVYNSSNSIITNGINWLIRNFNSAIENSKTNIGSQEIIDFDYKTENITKHQRFIYFHTPLPYAIIALIKTGNIYNENVFIALNAIVNNNNSGYWTHPNFDDSTQKPLWLIYDMVISLKTFTSSIQNWDNIKRIELKKNKLSFVSNDNPFSRKYFLNKFILGIWGKIFAIFIACIVILYLSNQFPNWTKEDYVSIILFPLIVELLGYYVTEINKKNQ